MNKQPTLIFNVVALIGLGLGVLGCDKPTTDAPAGKTSLTGIEDWEIRTYETKPEAGEPTVKALRRLLEAKPIKTHLHKGNEDFSKVSHIIPSQGRAWLAGTGLVALNAHPEIHEGVPDLIEKIAAAKAQQQKTVTGRVERALFNHSSLERTH